MRRRLTLTTVFALLVALTVVTVGFYLLLSSSLSGDADAALRARADAALATVQLRAGKVMVADSAGDVTLDAVTWVFAPDGTIALAPQSTAVALPDVAKLAGVRAPTFADVAPETRLLATPLRGAAAGEATVVVSVSLEEYERSEKIALASAVALDVAIVLVLAFVTRWLIGAALRPVDQMTRQAQDWLAHDVDRRFAVTSEASSAEQDEIGRLGVTLNDLLGRLGSSLRHERRLTDEIAHELRTPLARARAEAELSSRSENPAELRSALAAIVVDIDELTTTVDTLLRATRAPAGADARTSVTGAIRSALDLVHPAASIRVEPGDGRDESFGDYVAACEESLLQRILVPQLENAARHAVTQIRVSALRAGEMVLIEVADDGPGLDPDETERVFDPGHRGRASDGSEGSGLGLALARRLARSCGGDVTAAPGPGGRFITSLPIG